MRWFVGVVVAVLILWVSFIASPYLALWSLASALERGDVTALAARLNTSAIRVSIARQLAADELKGMGRATQSMSSTDQQLAAGAIALLADPILQRLLTPEGLLLILGRGLAGDSNGPERPQTDRLNAARSNDFGDVLGASRWRGFRNVYFALPPNAPPEQRMRLQLRLSRLKWRLVAIDLPVGLRRRLAKDLLTRAQDVP